MKSNFLIIVLLVLLFSSCQTTYYQLYEVLPVQEDISINNDDILFEDDNCKIIYNFWSGDITFSFYNKTDKNIYVDLTECFYIKNDVAIDLYENPKTTLEDRISIIPPKKYKMITGIPIMNNIQILCPLYVTQKDVQKGQNVHSFSLENSPLKFGSIIAYAFDKSCDNLIKIQQEFYVYKVSNFRDKDFLETYPAGFITDPCNTKHSSMYDEKRVRLDLYRSNRFYKTYSRQSSF